MEQAWELYGADSVRACELVEREDSFEVELGSGQCEPPDDPDVFALAVRMFSSLRTVRPGEVYGYVRSGDFTKNALGTVWQAQTEPPKRRRCVDTASEEWSVDSMRRSCKMWHISPNVLQRYQPTEETKEETKEERKEERSRRTLGHSKMRFSFSCDRVARLAIAVDRYHRVSPATVLEYICSVSKPRRRHLASLSLEEGDMLPLSLQGCVDALPLEQTVPFQVAHSAMRALVAQVESADASTPTATRLWARLGQRSILATQVTLVHHEWEGVEGGLRHRVLEDLRIDFESCLGGCTVCVRYSQQWPWFLSSQLQRLDLRPPPEEEEELPRRTVVSLSPSLAPECGKAQTVVDKWCKSARACGERGVQLLRVCQLGHDSVSDGTYTATRHVDLEDVKANTQPTFTDGFGKKYAEELVKKESNHHLFAVYSVKGEDGKVVAAFSVVLYECRLPGGKECYALMIDSFAVRKTSRGNGVGNVAYALCRKLVTRLSLAHVIFAQCVTKGDAALFWMDKLDSTSDARGMMWQAYTLDWGLVPVQAESQCAPRARVFDP